MSHVARIHRSDCRWAERQWMASWRCRRIDSRRLLVASHRCRIGSRRLLVASRRCRIGSRRLLVASRRCRTDSHRSLVASRRCRTDSRCLLVASRRCRTDSRRLLVASRRCRIDSRRLLVASRRCRQAVRVYCWIDCLRALWSPVGSARFAVYASRWSGLLPVPAETGAGKKALSRRFLRVGGSDQARAASAMATQEQFARLQRHLPSCCEVASLPVWRRKGWLHRFALSLARAYSCWQQLKKLPCCGVAQRASFPVPHCLLWRFLTLNWRGSGLSSWWRARFLV